MTVNNYYIDIKAFLLKYTMVIVWGKIEGE